MRASDTSSLHKKITKNGCALRNSVAQQCISKCNAPVFPVAQRTTHFFLRAQSKAQPTKIGKGNARKRHVSPSPKNNQKAPWPSQVQTTARWNTSQSMHDSTRAQNHISQAKQKIIRKKIGSIFDRNARQQQVVKYSAYYNHTPAPKKR
jgi:hypothetical protein